MIATDQAGASVSDIFAIAVENVNDAPIVSNAIADQSTKQGDAFNFQIPTNTFTDIDASDTLTYSATLENGNALPTWLTFNRTTRTFSGTPTSTDVGTLNVKVTASDLANTTASDIFAIDISAIVPSTLVMGTPGADDLKAGLNFAGVNQLIFTGAGDDAVDVPLGGADVGSNRIFTGSGADVIDVARNDRAFGGSGSDDFYAVDASDYRLSGGAGDDEFFLGVGGRALGGEGDDTFYVGESGGNTLSGGAGADAFWILTDNAALLGTPTTIVDFTKGTDILGIAGQGAGFDFADLSFSGSNILVGGIDGITIATVTGITTNTLTAANFTFSASAIPV